MKFARKYGGAVPARTFAAFLTLAVLAMLLLTTPMSAAALEKQPHDLLEETIQTLLDEFTSQRPQLEADKNKLFSLVDRIAEPLFDFKRISRLVLAGNWKKASKAQQQMFAVEFKKLLIRTYAIALFQYTGNETITFAGSEISERKGRKFAKVNSKVNLGGGQPPVVVIYSMILAKDGGWKIYNLSIEGLNMVVNYRNTYASSVASLGIDGMIASMKQTNAGKP